LPFNTTRPNGNRPTPRHQPRSNRNPTDPSSQRRTRRFLKHKGRDRSFPRGGKRARGYDASMYGNGRGSKYARTQRNARNFGGSKKWAGARCRDAGPGIRKGLGYYGLHLRGWVLCDRWTTSENSVWSMHVHGFLFDGDIYIFRIRGCNAVGVGGSDRGGSEVR
jgi:hypothetical protein